MIATIKAEGTPGILVRYLCDSSPPCTVVLEVRESGQGEQAEYQANLHAQKQGWFLGRTRQFCPTHSQP